MAKTVTEAYLSTEKKESYEEEIFQKAKSILEQHGVHNGLGLTQLEVSYLRRAKPSLKNALYVLFHAGKLNME